MENSDLQVQFSVNFTEDINSSSQYTPAGLALPPAAADDFFILWRLLHTDMTLQLFAANGFMRETSHHFQALLDR